MYNVHYDNWLHIDRTARVGKTDDVYGSFLIYNAETDCVSVYFVVEQVDKT